MRQRRKAALAEKSATAPNLPVIPGVISIHEIYTAEELFRRVGIGRAGIDEAKKRGLRVTRFGRKRVIRGADIDRFLAEQ